MYWHVLVLRFCICQYLKNARHIQLYVPVSVVNLFLSNGHDHFLILVLALFRTIFVLDFFHIFFQTVFVNILNFYSVVKRYSGIVDFSKTYPRIILIR